MYDAGNGQYLVHDDGKIAVRCATNGLPQARNSAVRAFLETDADWLFWVDTDMGFAPDTLARLIATADPETRPIVGALCFSSREVGFDGLNGFRTLPRPTIYDWVEMGDGHKRFVGRVVYPVNSLVRCAATGSACVVIHRSVFERLNDHAAEHGKPLNNWYECSLASDGSLMGEDISFCARAAALDIPTYVNTGARTTHLKPMWLGESQYWLQHPAPPATERVAVIVPVMGRPHHAAPFMTSLQASTGLATAYAVCDPGDHEAVTAWRRAGARLIFTDGTQNTFAQKVNRAFRKTNEPWVLLVGSDVHFWPGWLDHAEHVAHAFGAKVTGTNDLGNPRVLDGEHATHMLISRAYIDETGASWDGPGNVCHEGYGHWFVDDEIVTAAKQRGVWTMALGSRIEHIHPAFGKADHDDVYALGEKSVEADRALFLERLEANV